jgi:hypothetical protein
MSGGSYDYAYSKLDELDRWVNLLGDMARRCKEWAASDEAGTKWDTQTKTDVPTSTDRALLFEHGKLLENAAKHLETAVAKVHILRALMQAVEWVASGDYGIDALMVGGLIAPSAEDQERASLLSRISELEANMATATTFLCEGRIVCRGPDGWSVNVNPDGNIYDTPEAALARARQLAREGR